jgi:hypothetical protein
MGIKSRNKPKKIDLLEMPAEEKTKLMREIKESLRLKAAEAKLWQFLLQTENIIINGQQVFCETTSPTEFSLGDILKKM